MRTLTEAVAAEAGTRARARCGTYQLAADHLDVGKTPYR